MLWPVAYATVFGRPMFSGRGFFRVSCPPSGALVPEFSGPGSFGPLSSARKKKRLCQFKGSKYSINSVAISASNKKDSHLCELPDSDLTRTGYKCYIMVKPLTAPKKETIDEDVDMAPADAAAPDVDYGTPEGEQQQPPFKIMIRRIRE